MRVAAIGLSLANPAPAVAEELRLTRQAVQVASIEGDATGWFRRIEGIALSESQVFTRLTMPAGGARLRQPGGRMLPAAGVDGGLWEQVRALFGDADALPNLAAAMPLLDGPEQAGADRVMQVLLLVLSYRARDADGAPGAYRAADFAAGGLVPGVLVDYSV